MTAQELWKAIKWSHQSSDIIIIRPESISWIDNLVAKDTEPDTLVAAIKEQTKVLSEIKQTLVNINGALNNIDQDIMWGKKKK